MKRSLALAGIAATVSLGFTLWAYAASRAAVENDRRHRFERAVELVDTFVQERLAACEQLLHASGALFAASDSVERDDWRRFVSSVDLPARYPGIQSLGYVAVVRRGDLALFEARARSQGAPSFAVHPASEREDLFVVQYIEPLATNEEALGYDLGSEPARRAAAETARDSGRPAATAPLALVQDPERKPAFLLFLPVYRGAAALDSVPQRRAALQGWVYAGIRVADVMRGLPLGSGPDLDVEIFDGAHPSQETLLFDYDAEVQAHDPASPASFRSWRSIAVGGRSWSFHHASRPAFDLATTTREPLVVLLGGSLAGALIGGLVWSLASTRTRAVALADEMTSALREGEARLRAVVDNVVDGIVTFGEGGAIESLNAAAERIFGYPPSAVLGRGIEFLIPKASGELRDGFHSEATGRRKDGRTFPLELVISEMRHGDRRLLIAAVRDISERRAAERRQAAQHDVTRVLAESLTLEDALPRILETLGRTFAWDVGSFWAVDRGAASLRKRASWSAAPERYGEFLSATGEATLPAGTGLPGRVLQSGPHAWAADLERDRSVPGIPLALEAGLRGAFAFPVALGSEVLGVLEFLGRQTETPDEDMLRVFATLGSQVAQFMERDAADKALRASDERRGALVENMLEGLVVVDQRGLIESVNPAAERLFGYAAWELIGQHLKILVPRSIQDPEAFLVDATRRALGKVTEWDGRRKSGEIFRFELSLYEFATPDGRRFAGHMRDISERRRLEKMKKEFVATVSHELRTPLTAIRGSLSLLSGGALGELPDEARDVIGIAERNTLRLIDLINDILDLEQLEIGKMEMHFEILPAAGVLERSVESVRGMAEQQGIAIEVLASNATVFADGHRLVQVLVNLISNAIKFSPAGSTVTVSAEPAPGATTFRVQDRGRGIPPSFQEAIFERFQQVEASDARKKGGSGMGLAICKAIVEQHHGTIGVESQPGRGSSFWFRVPSAPPAEGRDAPQSAVSEGLGQDATGDVLLIEDDEALLGVMTRQLLQDGIPTRAARSWSEGLRAAREHPPALLVLDVALPDGDGFQIVDALRQDDALKGTPLLVYTVLDLDDDQRRRLHLGPTRFLIKSRASDREFRSMVREMVDAGRSAESGP